MDPLAHTLVGAALARTRMLDPDQPYRATTLVIAANLPDIDVVAYFAGSDAALLHRRGITHGPIGLVVLPALLVAVVLLIDRWRTRSDDQSRARPTIDGLLCLAYLGALTHPVLDWLNTYGVRLLSPFSDRWFYGDVLFIVDPWFWLLLAAGLFLGTRPSARATGRWLALAILTSALVLLTPIPAGAKVAWLASVALLAGARWLLGDLSRHRQALASWFVVAWLCYLSAMTAGALASRSATRSELEAEGLSERVESFMVGPLPATPFDREVVVELEDRYLTGSFSWRSPAGERIALSEDEIAKRPPTPTGPGGLERVSPGHGNFIDQALTDPSVAGFVNWMRFPYVEIDTRADGSEVYLIDVRYLRRRPTGPADFGGTRVTVPAIPD